MQNNLLNTLIEVLKKDERFISNEWDLLKNTIREKAENLDENLIFLLLDNETLREIFFIKVKDVIVFDNNRFIKFITNKNVYEDNYSRFKRRIWLTNEKGDFIASSNEVVLSFPFKDCVLAWWQDKDEQKRDEVFYNEILWQDDIDRLFDKKVFTNFKRIDKDWEHKLEWFNRDENGTISDNLIIKWNNLLALHSLKLNFAWKVKLIYIDPPYNTWNDSFNYNDKFNHSTWLTFMKNRLEIAKELLRDDWVIFVSLSDKEAHYCKVLMDEIFWNENFLADIIWNSTKSVTNTAIISDSHTHNLVYFKRKYYFVENRTNFRLKDDWNGFSNPDNDIRWPWKADPFQVWWWRPNQQYEIINPNTGKVYKPNKDCSWKNDYDKFQELLNDNRIVFWVNWDAWPQRKRFLSEALERGKVSKTIWTDLDTTTNWTQHLKKLFWEQIFRNPKPEWLLERIIDLSTQIWDIILDYHLWSGTTCAVAHKMWRQYIWIEQMDYIETISKERMKKVIEWEDWWISKNIEWKWWWEFVYMEIMQENEKILEIIKNAKNINDLQKIYNQIKDSEFINYKVDTWNLNFDNLNKKDFEDFKLFLIEILDKNLLYKNYSERNDKNSEVSENDKKLNNLFYNN